MAEGKGGGGAPRTAELQILEQAVEEYLSSSNEALATLLGKPVEFIPSGCTAIAGAPAIDKSSDRVVAEVPISGDLQGNCLLLCEASEGARLVDLLMGGEGGAGDRPLAADDLNALSELVNQAAGAAMTALCVKCKMECRHAVQRVFSLTPDSVDAFSNSLDYPVAKISWCVSIGDGVLVKFDQLVERRLWTGLVELASKAQQTAEETEAVTPGGIARLVEASSEEVPDVKGASAGRAAGGGQAKGSDARAGGGKAVTVQSHEFPEIQSDGPIAEPRKIEMLLDVPLHLTVELGRTKRLVKDILQLGPGSVLELDKLAGEAVDVLVNGKLLAKAEVVVIDENFGVRVTEIVSRTERIKELRQ